MKKQIHLHPDDLKKSDQMGQAHKRMLLKQSSIMKKYGLTARQALIIAYLSTHKKEVVTQKVLEDHLHLTNPTITVMVRTMIKKGLIRKERVEEDARKYRLFLTDRAKEVEEVSRREAIDLDRRFYQGVSDTDMKIFQGGLGYRLTYVHQEPIHFGSFLLHSRKTQTRNGKTF